MSSKPPRHLPAASAAWRIANDPTLDRDARLRRLQALEAKLLATGAREGPQLFEIRAAQTLVEGQPELHDSARLEAEQNLSPWPRPQPAPG